MANRPLIVAVLYLGTFFTGVSGLVGIVLAYVFRSGPNEDWERTHFAYLIKTFWIFAAAFALAFVAVIFVVAEAPVGGFLALPAAALGILAGARSVLAMINAAQQKPMPKPNSWLL